MSDDDFGFAPPPFDAANALLQIQRALRDLRLTERGNGFEQRGKRLVELTPGAAAIHVRIARKPALTPQWDTQVLRSTGDQRKLIDEIRKRLARWASED